MPVAMPSDDLPFGTKVNVIDGPLKGETASRISLEEAKPLLEEAGTTHLLRQVGKNLIWIKLTIFGRLVAVQVRRMDVVVASNDQN